MLNAQRQNDKQMNDLPKPPSSGTARRFPRVDLPMLEHLSEVASQLMERARNAALEPNHRKVLRKWSGPEVTAFLDNISVDTLYRRLKRDPNLPQGEQISARRREFSLEDIHGLQDAFGLRPRRNRAQNKPLVISVCNFKGGVAKTTSSIHLGQYLCLQGYRVLMVDLDAQASLTQLFGILPHSEVENRDTVLPFLEGPKLQGDPNPDWTGTLKTAIRKTHWHDLDLICSNLALYGAEFSIAGRALQEPGYPFYRILSEGLDTVKDDYDVIIMDTAPSLSFLNTNALYAADGLIVSLPPAMLDLQSASLFFELMTQVVTTINNYEAKQKIFDFTAILISRFDGGKAVHQQISSWIRAQFGSITLTHPMLQTTVLEKIGPEILTAYEVESYDGDKRTFERALEALNNVNAEIEGAMREAWSAAPDTGNTAPATPEPLRAAG